MESKNIYFCNSKPYFNLHLDGVFYNVEILFAEDVLLQENFISCCEHVEDIEIYGSIIYATHDIILFVNQFSSYLMTYCVLIFHKFGIFQKKDFNTFFMG